MLKGTRFTWVPCTSLGFCRETSLNHTPTKITAQLSMLFGEAQVMVLPQTNLANFPPPS